jgi:Endoplasmic reticulum-based factor for assembly of V-ATPase
MQDVCRGGGLHLQPPPPRVRSKELQERLQRLRAELQEKEYAQMVQDITQKVRLAHFVRVAPPVPLTGSLQVFFSDLVDRAMPLRDRRGRQKRREKEG